MTVEIRTKGVKPLASSFGHLQRRFGDKPATRYQEATFDIQSTANFHYKPLWDPEREMFDARRTAIVMKDWYQLKDPRQFYYGNYAPSSRTPSTARWISSRSATCCAACRRTPAR